MPCTLLGTFNENFSTSLFFASFQTSELETQRPPFITSSKMQISATPQCKSSHHSLIFPPSNSLLANYCTAVFLRAVQNAIGGGLKEPSKETQRQQSSFRASHDFLVVGRKANCRVWWDLLAFSLLLLLSCSCLPFISFFTR